MFATLSLMVQVIKVSLDLLAVLVQLLLLRRVKSPHVAWGLTRLWYLDHFVDLLLLVLDRRG